MNLLPDTRTFLWWNLDASQSSACARQAIADSSNMVYFSAVSASEITLKAARGRLHLPERADRYVVSRLRHYSFTPLPISIAHSLAVVDLPDIHTDPFHRLLIA